jgi:hypothetical protein
MIEIELGKDRFHLNKEMESWCVENIGRNSPGNWVFANPDNWHERKWAMSSQFGNTTFYFRDEQDAILFSLRWK